MPEWKQGCEARGKRWRAKGCQIIIEVAAFGDDDGGANAGARAAPREAFGGSLALGIVIPGDDEA